MSLNFHIIIPARLNSTRLEKKMLLPIGKKLLLQHTYEKALAVGAASVTIATDDQEIVDKMTALGANVLLTSPNHPTGTDRLAEAVNLLGLDDEAIVVNLQGDEPCMPEVLVQQVANNLANTSWADIATLCVPMKDLTELKSTSIVKVVFADNGAALYFSRAVIPAERDAISDSDIKLDCYFRHLGLYAYRVKFLRDYKNLTAPIIERLEQLEQLRALYYGYKIHIALAVADCPPGVDTEADFINILKKLDVFGDFLL